jgi:peroxiredoxin
MSETTFAINSILLWLAVILNFVLVLALARRLNSRLGSGQKNTYSAPTDTLKIGEIVPDFTAETLDKRSITLASFKGRPFSLIFIGPNCQPCRAELPSLEALKSKAQKAGVELMLISISDEIETQTFVNETKTTLPVLVAHVDKNSFMHDYKVKSTPTYYLIDENGKVAAVGHPQDTTWKKLLDSWAAKGKNTSHTTFATTS